MIVGLLLLDKSQKLDALQQNLYSQLHLFKALYKNIYYPNVSFFSEKL